MQLSDALRYVQISDRFCKVIRCGPAKVCDHLSTCFVKLWKLFSTIVGLGERSSPHAAGLKQHQYYTWTLSKHIKTNVVMEMSFNKLTFFNSSGRMVKAEAWILRKLVFLFNRTAKRGHRPREAGIRELMRIAGIDVPDVSPRGPRGPLSAVKSYMHASISK